MHNQKQPAICHCESNKSYQSCCEPFHKGLAVPDAEKLMRSRYSAYVLQLENYLLETWHPNTRPNSLELSSTRHKKWLGLTIKQHQVVSETLAFVTFVARYKDGGSKAERLHEVSNFVLLDRWYYLDGTFAD